MAFQRLQGAKSRVPEERTASTIAVLYYGKSPEPGIVLEDFEMSGDTYKYSSHLESPLKLFFESSLRINQLLAHTVTRIPVPLIGILDALQESALPHCYAVWTDYYSKLSNSKLRYVYLHLVLPFAENLARCALGSTILPRHIAIGLSDLLAPQLFYLSTSLMISNIPQALVSLQQLAVSALAPPAFGFPSSPKSLPLDLIAQKTKIIASMKARFIVHSINLPAGLEAQVVGFTNGVFK
ncbi:uncharacterized protein BDR25DRAFT_356596 [Lindgomyces ingoldianus]|uniref:Uncharacterized protein n=1 Tax=Lindgomyces ingoldianus TaxID=673940 RepID=A0ACB6QQT9_9PLEO|nr:uncharacterized protein BDR25DRAFT_356596 [Lindgomyces ingoldianus]KAF2469364.1 hypothetical protein BDR25DRAFT_356596 [Lindgomyces ingoldianus]